MFNCFCFVAEVELYRRKKVTVKPNSGTSVSFMITATSDGYTEVKVSASSTNLQDTVQKSLLVKVRYLNSLLNTYIPFQLSYIQD